jgi:ABC-type transporter Mla maintaining outer membrane lipid asymmetry ATPase subunit MlaF
MSNEFTATIEGRELFLAADEVRQMSLSLDQGGRHRLVIADSASAGQVVAALESCPGVGVLPADGGLLGALTVADNFALALRYGSEFDDSLRDEQDLAAALKLCGLTAERVAMLGRAQPMNLDRIERWTLGFVRWLLRPPELLVIDRLFVGLARRQADALIALEMVYYRRHPFRAVLFVDLDSHELPELPQCRSLTRLAETPCHC